MKTATEPAAPAETDEYMTVGEVAKKLRVTPMTIYTAIHEGRLEAVRVGRRTFRIPVESYRAYTSTTPTELHPNITAASSPALPEPVVLAEQADEGVVVHAA
jgi:excisionase family DNA binding protein